MPLPTPGVPTASTDAVAVYDSAFRQLFAGARPVSAKVSEMAKTFEHPLETGATIVDYRVILPIEIELALIVPGEDYRNVYSEIKQVFTRGQVVTVLTKTAAYRNMLIVGMPHEENPDMFDAITIALSLREALFVDPQFAKLAPRQVRDPANASTVQKGDQRPVADTRPASTLFRVLN